MCPVPISDRERRARLIARHHLGSTAREAHEAVRSVVAFHSTDPATPYLGARARVEGLTIDDLDRALFEDRTLWRLHAMRRTLFIIPVEDGAIIGAAASRGVAAIERRRLEGWLSAEMPAKRIPVFLAGLESRILELLDDGAERLTREITSEIPELGTEITVGSGKWTTRSPLSSRLLFLMAMDGRLVRTRPAGSWRSSQYRWAIADDWFGAAPAPPDPDGARAELVRRYLTAYGPAMLEDIRWWTGWTVKQIRQAVDRIGAVPVRLDGDEEGLDLPHRLEERTEPVRFQSVDLLPALDPTPMGWKRRDWFLGSHGDRLFDRNGNVGPTVWADGRIVGGWAQRADGDVVFRLLEDVGKETEEATQREAADLTSWLRGTVVTPRFRTPLEKELTAK